MKLQIGIRSKLFAMIAAIIGFIFIVQMVFQAFWLENFYLEGLARGVEDELASAESHLSTLDLSQTDIAKKAMTDIRLNSDQPVLLTSSSGLDYVYDVSLSDGSYIAFQPTDSDFVYNIPVDSDAVDLIASNPDIKSSPIYVEGYINDVLGELVPTQIKIDDAVYNADELTDFGNWDLEDNVIYDDSSLSVSDDSYLDMDDDIWNTYNGEGQLVYFQIGSTYNDDYTYSEDILINKILELTSSNTLASLDEYTFETAIHFDEYNQTNNLIIYKQINREDVLESTKSDEKYYLFSIISFASIEEPLKIYQEYNWITMLTGAFFAILLVLLFTGRIVKPIKNMERVTSNMAKLDFNERIPVTSSDEIGQLAHSFNQLSDKLKSSIDDMQALNLTLEMEVQERTKQQNILKDFIGNASHELKTPITILKGLMDGVEDGIYDPDSDIHKQSLQDEVIRMEQIVYNLLQVSKMERGAQQVHYNIFEPSEIIYSTYQRHKKRGSNKNISFQFDMEDVFVSADPQLIESVIDNLIGNALNYSKPNAEVYCRVHSFSDQVFISVENTKANIPEEDLARIFDPFYRVDKSHTRETGGTGLGLSIIKSILELHGSGYEMINTPKGVKFTFTLKQLYEGEQDPPA